MTTTTLDRRTAPFFGVQLGDYFVSSWGYDQTNVDYYRVVELRGKSTVLLRQVRQARFGEHRTSETVVPMSAIELDDESQFYDHCIGCNNLIERDPITDQWVHCYGRYSDAPRPTTCERWNERKKAREPVTIEPKIYRKQLRLTTWRAEDPEPYVSMTSYASAYLWDLKPKYQTAPGFGH